MRQVAAGEERKETGRLEAFSDGVFAVAITLLVFNLAIPTVDDLNSPHHHVSLAQFVASHGIQFVTYVVSFLTILVMWMNHHSLSQVVVRLDRPFILLNGLLLLCTTFVNYPTALVATFIGTPDGRFAAALYSATFIVIGLLYTLLWHRAGRGGRLIIGGMDQRAVDGVLRRDLGGVALYSVAFLLAFANAWASVLLSAALAVFFALTVRISPPEPRTEPGEPATVAATTEGTTA